MDGMKKLLFIAALGLMVPMVLTAQQVGRYSMFMQNPYVFNPAAAGMEDLLDVTLAYRKQWVGVGNSPAMYLVSANMPLNRDLKSPRPNSMRISKTVAYSQFENNRTVKQGVGILAGRQEFGAFQQVTAFGSYAVHVPMSKRLTLGLGANAGFRSYQFEQSLVNLENPSDPLYQDFVAAYGNRSNQLNIDLGFMLYHPAFYIGLSTDQMLGEILELNGDVTQTNYLVHYKLMGAKIFWVGRMSRLIPSALLYFSRTGLLATEINLRWDYGDVFWSGISYRHGNAVIPMVGAYINNRIKIGYAYDYTLSNLGNYNTGSHELMLGLFFGSQRRIF